MGVLMTLYDGSAEHHISLYGIGVPLRPTDQHAYETLTLTPPFNYSINNSLFKTFFLFYDLCTLLIFCCELRFMVSGTVQMFHMYEYFF